MHHNDTDFTDRNVLVVGGSSGIGNGIAHAFRARGARVHVWGTRPNAADYHGIAGSDLDGLGYDGVDVTDPDTVAAAPAPFDRLDVLVLSQGTSGGRDEFEREGWDRVFAINLDSLMHCARKFKPRLAAQRGSIIIISSLAGLNAIAAIPAYSASKAGAVSLTRSLGQAWAADGVRVNGIAPGFVETKINKDLMADPKSRTRVLKRIAAGRFGEPSEIAGGALFLASPLASYVNGHTLVIDGGTSL